MSVLVSQDGGVVNSGRVAIGDVIGMTNRSARHHRIIMKSLRSGTARLST